MGGESAAILPGRAVLIEDVVAAVATGSAATVVLEGDAGVGKTAVLRAASRRTSPAWEWSTTCLEAEADFGMVLLGDLFSALPAEVVAAVPAAQRRAIRAVLCVADAAASAEELITERLLGLTAASLLRELTKRGAVLLVIDDLQWCDAASLRVLNFALRRAGGSVTVLAACRRGQLPATLDGARVLAVPPLSASAVRDLVVSVAPTVPRAVADRIIDVAQGNAFFASELARAAASGEIGETLPDTVRDALRRRLHGLGAACWRGLVDIAVRGSIPAQDAAVDDLEAAFLRQILQPGDPVHFTHPLISSAVLEQATPGQVRSAYARAAEASNDPVAVARFRARAEPAGAELAEVLDEASDLAHRRGDVEGARDLAELALARTPGGQRPPERLHKLLILEAALGNNAIKGSLSAELLEAATTDEHRAVAEWSLLVEAADHAHAATRFPELIALPELTFDTRAGLTSAWADELLVLGRAEDASHVLGSWLDANVKPSPMRLRIRAERAYLMRLSGHPIPADELDDLIRGAGAEDALSGTLGHVGVLAFLDDRYADARALLREGAERNRFERIGMYRAALYLPMLACRLGELDAARTAMRGYVDVATGPARGLGLARLIPILSWLGDDTDAVKLRAEARSLVPETDASIAAEVEFATGFADLLAGRIDQAWGALRTSVELLERLGRHEPMRPPALPAAVEAAAALGKLPEAEELCARLGFQAQRLNSRGARAATLAARGHIAVARQESDRAQQLFADSAESFATLGAVLEAARAHLAHGALLRRLGRRREARDTLTVARDIFAQCGADGLTRSADAELARISGRGRADDTKLTESERQVAELVAGGMRNSDVARTLHLSVKTIETHLGRTYRKLGVANRTELSAKLAAEHDPAPR